MKNKKILMFGPAFFGYRECIAEQLRAMGAQVDLYDERPSNSALAKILLRYNIGLYRPAVMQYYRTIAEANKGKQYDYIFVIKSEAINREVFQMLKQAYPGAQFILYLWDSVDNVPDGESKIKMYDRVLTFDHVDAKKYGLTLRPLFFRKEYEAAPVQTKEFSYDVSFIGTAHSIRPYVVNRIDEALRAVGRKCFRFLYLPHPIVFIYNKLLNRDYRTVRKSDIQFTPMQAEEIRRVYDTSRCILDVEHPAQRGLTMRTIEMVGMNKKLITTNAGIADYDFYHPNNICIIDRKSPVIPEEFFTTPYVEIPHEILNRYSLKSFVRDIFGIHEQP